MWEEPPLSRRGAPSIASTLEGAIAQLRARPNAWARLRTWPGKASAAGALKPLRTAYPDCTFVARRYQGGSAIWAACTRKEQ